MRDRVRHPNYPKLVIFQTPNGQSANWYAGFYHKGKFIRQSTGSDEKKRALKIAEEWFIKNQTRIVSGDELETPSKRLFKHAIKHVKEDMQVKRNSPAYQKSMMDLLRETYYIHQFFGAMPLDQITSATWDEYRHFLFRKRGEEDKKPLSEKTIHQHKIAVQRVLKTARKKKWTEELVRFEDIDRPKQETTIPRIYFNLDEYRTLLQASRANVNYHRESSPNKGRWLQDALEQHDFIIWMANTGMRVGEAMQLEFRHVRIVERQILVDGERQTREVCLFTVTKGKRGAGEEAESFIGAPSVFRRICERRGIKDPKTSRGLLFEKRHTYGFARLLKDCKLDEDNYGRKRDFVSLRHTYIVFRLQQGADIYDIARNTRTSVPIIQKHYARFFKKTKTLNDIVWGDSE
jgi:site-specific recombinase XerD